MVIEEKNGKVHHYGLTVPKLNSRLRICIPLNTHPNALSKSARWDGYPGLPHRTWRRRAVRLCGVDRYWTASGKRYADTRYSARSFNVTQMIRHIAGHRLQSVSIKMRGARFHQCINVEITLAQLTLTSRCSTELSFINSFQIFFVVEDVIRLKFS